MIHIKTLTDRHGDKWLEISKEKFEANYTDRINYTYSVSQDDNKMYYYEKEIKEIYDKDWFLSQRERSVD